MMRPGSRVAVVFGGGGAKAGAHAGAHRAIQEAGLRPVHYVATSMGSLFAALFAAGLGPDEVLARVGRIRLGDVVARDPLAIIKGLWAKAVLKEAPLRNALRDLLPVKNFEDLKTPLTVTAVPLDTGELVLFGAGSRTLPLADAIYASCALPVYYPPAVIDGRRYADGGLRAVLPLEPAVWERPDLVVAVDIGPGFDERQGPGETSALPAILQAHDDAMGILMAANTQAALAHWRSQSDRPPLVYVRPRVERGATFRVDQMQRYAEEGYRATRAALAEQVGGAQI
jgi:NTE family protein